MKTNRPPREFRAKTGTNIRGGVMAAHRSALLAKQAKPLKRLFADYRRASKKLFSKSELRAAESIRQRIWQEYHAANLKHGPDAMSWAANHAAFRRRLQRALAQTLPRLREWRALTNAFQRDCQKLFQAASVRPRAGDIRVSLDQNALPDSPTAEEYLAPFGVYDVAMSEVGNYPDIEDNSFAIPGNGHVVNNLELEYDDSTWWFPNGLFGIYLPVHGWSHAGCGINYNLPKTGRLRIGAVVRNFYARVTMSLEDNFGFSMGRVHGSANLYVDIVRGRNITTLSKTLVEKTLESDGDDVSTTLPQLDDINPYVIDVTTDETYQAGAAVQIIAGTEFVSGCTLDDMVANVKALLWSQVQKITVDVI